MDKNNNGLIERSEFEAAGWEGLQSFRELGADGHHYDVESGQSKTPSVPVHMLKYLMQNSSFIMKKSSILHQIHRLSTHILFWKEKSSIDPTIHSVSLMYTKKTWNISHSTKKLSWKRRTRSEHIKVSLYSRTLTRQQPLERRRSPKSASEQVVLHDNSHQRNRTPRSSSRMLLLRPKKSLSGERERMRI